MPKQPLKLPSSTLFGNSLFPFSKVRLQRLSAVINAMFVYQQQCERFGAKRHGEAEGYHDALQGRDEDGGGRLRLQRLQGREGQLQLRDQTLKLSNLPVRLESVCLFMAKISRTFIIFMTYYSYCDGVRVCASLNPS